MGKIFATKKVFVRTAYYFQGIGITNDLVMSLCDTRWKMCTPERIAAASIEVRTIETPMLVALIPQDYSGPGLPQFVKEEGGLVYFHKEYGDRPAGYELRARVAEEVGEIVVLREFEERRFYREGYGPKHDPIYTDWYKVDREGQTF